MNLEMDVENARKVLVVDDEDHILRVVSFKLRGAGYEVLEASDGEEAWEILRTQSVDLVITDQQMPYMTGLELVETMRKQPRTADVPVLMLSARGFRLDTEELERADVLALVAKPFSPRMLLSHVRAVIGPATEEPEDRSAA
ncbi:MAG: response regulator [Phycisphaerales bacterium]|nr:response regulator [Phycisphaerales bacterium]